MLTAVVTGNLGNDGEMKYSANGAPFLRFNVASNRRDRDADGAVVETTEWVRCTVFGARAEALQNYMVKGVKVAVSGRLESRPWITDQDEARAGLEMIVAELDFLSSRQDDDGGRQQGRQQQQPRQQGRQAPQQRQQQPQQRQTPQRGRSQQTQQTMDQGDLDDLPF